VSSTAQQHRDVMLHSQKNSKCFFSPVFAKFLSVFGAWRRFLSEINAKVHFSDRFRQIPTDSDRNRISDRVRQSTTDSDRFRQIQTDSDRIRHIMRKLALQVIIDPSSGGTQVKIVCRNPSSSQPLVFMSEPRPCIHPLYDFTPC
jgi:hypothetical protein